MGIKFAIWLVEQIEISIRITVNKVYEQIEKEPSSSKLVNRRKNGCQKCLRYKEEKLLILVDPTKCGLKYP
jgi:hypothetical protein